MSSVAPNTRPPGLPLSPPSPPHHLPCPAGKHGWPLATLQQLLDFQLERHRAQTDEVIKQLLPGMRAAMASRQDAVAGALWAAMQQVGNDIRVTGGVARCHDMVASGWHLDGGGTGTGGGGHMALPAHPSTLPPARLRPRPAPLRAPPRLQGTPEPEAFVDLLTAFAQRGQMERVRWVLAAAPTVMVKAGKCPPPHVPHPSTHRMPGPAFVWGPASAPLPSDLH